MIYKILSRTEWQSAIAAGTFDGADIDRKDGFIHFSAAHQVKETAAKHFHGRDDLVLVEVDDVDLGEALKWEVSRGGDHFPHLYSNLDVRHARRVTDLPVGSDGTHLFPDPEQQV